MAISLCKPLTRPRSTKISTSGSKPSSPPKAIPATTSSPKSRTYTKSSAIPLLTVLSRASSAPPTRTAEAVPDLRKNIDDEDSYARANAAVALERIGA